jgi:hypothetical protein
MSRTAAKERSVHDEMVGWMHEKDVLPALRPPGGNRAGKHILDP